MLNAAHVFLIQIPPNASVWWYITHPIVFLPWLQSV